MERRKNRQALAAAQHYAEIAQQNPLESPKLAIPSCTAMHRPITGTLNMQSHNFKSIRRHAFTARTLPVTAKCNLWAGQGLPTGKTKKKLEKASSERPAQNATSKRQFRMHCQMVPRYFEVRNFEFLGTCRRCLSQRSCTPLKLPLKSRIEQNKRLA